LALIAARRVRHGRAIFAATTVAGLALAALGAADGTRLAVALLCTVGVSGGFALSLIVAGIQANAEEGVRGRVVSMYTIISQVVPAASGVAAGALVQAYGVRVALLVCGAALAVAMLANASWMTALRRYRG
jgi:predicted MFS family arabinose efflux permease